MSTAYDPIIRAAGERFSIPFGLLKGLIAHESGFNPRAYRQEPNDASRGLMQLLYSTARGLGYTGTVEGLFDPVVNIGLGAKLLRGLFDTLGNDWLRALSAYNGGNRPQYAFGTRATNPGRVCLAKNTAGECVRWFNYQAGQFGNQPYVDAVVKQAARYGWTPMPDFSGVQGGSSSTAVTLPPKPVLGPIALPTAAELAVEISGPRPVVGTRAPLSTTNKVLTIAIAIGALLFFLSRR